MNGADSAFKLFFKLSDRERRPVKPDIGARGSLERIQSAYGSEPVFPFLLSAQSFGGSGRGRGVLKSSNFFGGVWTKSGSNLARRGCRADAGHGPQLRTLQSTILFGNDLSFLNISLGIGDTEPWTISPVTDDNRSAINGGQESTQFISRGQ
jgi:hypothetical protein